MKRLKAAIAERKQTRDRKTTNGTVAVTAPVKSMRKRSAA